MWTWLVERLGFWSQAFGLWWLGLALLWSIFSNATTIRDNFLSPERQEKWRTLRLIPEISWYWWVIGLLFLTFVAAMEGSFRAWRDQRDRTIQAQEELFAERVQNRPDLRGSSVDAMSAGEAMMTGSDGSKMYAYFMMVATIRNTGAPTIVDRYSLLATFKDGSSQEGFITSIPSDWTVSYPNGQTELINETEALDLRTLRPIERGGKIHGRLLFVFMNRQKEWLKQNTAELQLCFFDAWGEKYSVASVLSGIAENIPAFPGLAQPKRPPEVPINSSSPIKRPPK